MLTYSCQQSCVTIKQIDWRIGYEEAILIIPFKDVSNLFAAFAGDDLKGRTVTFIPTAAVHEKVNFYVSSEKKALEKMGLLVDELEISTAAVSEMTSKLQTMISFMSPGAILSFSFRN